MDTITVPYWLPSMPSTGAALRVYMVLVALGAGHEWTNVSLRELSRLTGSGTTAIVQALRSMEELGVLSRRDNMREDGGRGATSYRVETGSLEAVRRNAPDFPF